MPEIDHIIIFSALDAPEAHGLRARGLLEGSGQSHPGQGTANRRFFFENFYLELLWVSNEVEARSDLVEPTQLWQRWSHRHSGECPFGLVLRPGREVAAPPFPTWSYRPAYLPPESSIEVASGIKSTEPLLFYLPFAGGRRPPPSEPKRHPAQIGELMSLRLHLPGAAALSPSWQGLVAASAVSVVSASSYLLELTVEGCAAGPLDCRPELPLVFSPRSAAA